MGDFAERGLREIINSYKLANTGVLPLGAPNGVPNGTFIELEIKTQDNQRDVFERVFAGAQAAPETFTGARLELSVNIISDNVYEKNNGKSDRFSASCRGHAGQPRRGLVLLERCFDARSAEDDQ